MIKDAKLIIKRDKGGVFRLYLKQGKTKKPHIFCPRLEVVDIKVEGTKVGETIFLQIFKPRKK